MIAHPVNPVQSLKIQGLQRIFQPRLFEDLKMLNRNNTHLTLPTVRLVLGICAIVLSLLFSIEFVSAGSSGGAIIAAIVFALITEFCKVVLTGDLFYYWETGQGSKTLFSAVIVAILFALFISAAVFCLTIAPSKNEAIVTQSDSRIESLNKAIADKQEQIAACNQSYLSKCVNPRTAELNALQSQLADISKQSDNLTDAKAQAAFWAKAAEYLGTNPHSLQMNFAIARAVLLDVLGLILISQYTASRRLQNQKINDFEGGFSHILPAENAALIENMKLIKQVEDLKMELAKKP